MKNKKIVLFLAMVLFLLKGIDSVEASQIYYKNKPIVNNLQVEVGGNGNTYISAVDLAKVLGARAVYNDKDRTLELNSIYSKAKFYLDKDKADFDNQTLKIDQKVTMINNRVVLPIELVSSNFGYDIKYLKDEKKLLIDSDAEKLKKNNNYDKEEVQKGIKEVMGEKIYKELAFDYLQTQTIEKEKYLTDGQYHIFKSYKRVYRDSVVNGFYFYNILTKDMYLYSLGDVDASKKVIRYYPNGKKEYVEPIKTNITNEFMANVSFVTTVNNAKNIFLKYQFEKTKDISKQNENVLPKDKQFYYYRAYSKTDKGKKKSEFDIVQDKVTLEVYIFLKDKEKINVVKV